MSFGKWFDYHNKSSNYFVEMNTGITGSISFNYTNFKGYIVKLIFFSLGQNLNSIFIYVLLISISEKYKFENVLPSWDLHKLLSRLF